MKEVLPKRKNFFTIFKQKILKMFMLRKERKKERKKKKEKWFPCVNIESPLYLVHISGSTILVVYFKFKNYRLNKDTFFICTTDL